MGFFFWNIHYFLFETLQTSFACRSALVDSTLTSQSVENQPECVKYIICKASSEKKLNEDFFVNRENTEN